MGRGTALRGLLILALVLLAAPRAKGDEVPAAEPPDIKRGLELNFRWDEGPVYELWVLTPQLDSEDRLGIVRDLGVVGRIGGSLFLDGGFVSGEGLGNSWDADVRRARIETYGHVSHWLETDYKFAVGFEKNKVYVNDFWVAWKPSWIDRIRIGYIDPPYSMEALASSTNTSFMEEAAPVSAFAPGYRLGIEARDQIGSPDIAWTTSISSVGQSQRFRDASDSPLRLSVRAAWRPEGVSDDPDAELLHIGLSAGYSFSGSGDVHYRSRPESSLTSYLVDTGDIHGDAEQLGVELARRSGPLRLEAEWLGSWVNGSSRSYFFSGSYAEVGWALTGEVRHYDPKSALFTQSVPLNPFSWERGTWGGLELAGRVSYVDLTDGDVRGGRMLAVSGASIWSLNRFVRIHLDLIYADVKDRPGFGSNLITQMRLELAM